MSGVAAMVIDDASISWLLVGRSADERFAQLRGPQNATLRDLDKVLAGRGWERTAPWQGTARGGLISFDVRVADRLAAEIFARWLNRGELPASFPTSC